MPPHVDACIRLSTFVPCDTQGRADIPGCATCDAKNGDKGAILDHASFGFGGLGWGFAARMDS
eukprot:7480387-Alexandrium_andersonii.AAC.1